LKEALGVVAACKQRLLARPFQPASIIDPLTQQETVGGRHVADGGLEYVRGDEARAMRYAEQLEELAHEQGIVAGHTYNRLHDIRRRGLSIDPACLQRAFSGNIRFRLQIGSDGAGPLVASRGDCQRLRTLFGCLARERGLTIAHPLGRGVQPPSAASPALSTARFGGRLAEGWRKVGGRCGRPAEWDSLVPSVRTSVRLGLTLLDVKASMSQPSSGISSGLAWSPAGSG